MLTLLAVLVLVAAALHLLLAGVVRLLVQFPARRRMAPVDLARYFRATDLGGGSLLYPLLGAEGPAVTWIAFALAATSSAPGAIRPLLVASVCLLAMFVIP